MRSETNQMKKMNKKGFTLAELLIVVAIIAVLVAIAIPVFSAQLEKSRDATDLANVRSAYGEAVAQYLSDGSVSSTFSIAGCTFSASETSGVITVEMTGGIQSKDDGVKNVKMVDGVIANSSTSTGG